MKVMSCRVWFGCLALALVATDRADALTPNEVLLVGNAASAASRAIAEHYARARELPADHILLLTGLAEDPPDQISRQDYEHLIQAPIAAWLGRRGAQDRIACIVLTKGLPLRIAGTRGRAGTIASVDSELTLLYRRLAGTSASVVGAIANPYFLNEAPLPSAQPFSHEQMDVYLVTRLDGFTVDDVIGLIDRGRAPSTAGRIVLDERAGWTHLANEWLRISAERLRQAGHAERVVHDATSQPVTDQSDLLGYYSWGTNDPAIRVRRLGLRFAPGGIAAAYVATDGRTFREPPAEWQAGGPGDRFFAGSADSLAGDLIRDGVTGIAAQVADPYLDGAVRPQILFPAYLAGFSLAEAFYLAMPSLSWQTIIVGDPLCAPFSRADKVSAAPPATDPATELPVWFARRRVASLLASGFKREGVEAFARAEARQARDDAPGATEALEEAVRLEPRLIAAHHLLATVYERAGDVPKAEARYRAVLEVAPDDVIALNNLAYLLAVDRKAPSEGLPLAQRARTLAPGLPLVADTLGWIYFLLGDARQAAVLIDEALQSAPGSPEVWLHSALVRQALGDPARARADLTRALELNAALAERPEVERLQQQLP